MPLTLERRPALSAALVHLCQLRQASVIVMAADAARYRVSCVMVQEKKQQQLAALDSQYQAKIMAEVERYQALMQEKELLNHKWDEQNATLVEAHEKVVQEIAEEMEAKLMEEQMNYNQLQQKKEDMAREFEEVKQQLEEDADRCDTNSFSHVKESVTRHGGLCCDVPHHGPEHRDAQGN